MARITIRVPDEVDDEIEDLLGYNDSKSGFYRDAAEEKLERDHGVAVDEQEAVPDGGEHGDG